MESGVRSLTSADQGIDGVIVVPLRRIPDERGTILHMLRRDDPHFIEFGEIYFTSVYRDENPIQASARQRLNTD